MAGGYHLSPGTRVVVETTKQRVYGIVVGWEASVRGYRIKMTNGYVLTAGPAYVTEIDANDPDQLEAWLDG